MARRRENINNRVGENERDTINRSKENDPRKGLINSLTDDRR